MYANLLPIKYTTLNEYQNCHWYKLIHSTLVKITAAFKKNNGGHFQHVS
jgi:hypothetical protein